MEKIKSKKMLKIKYHKSATVEELVEIDNLEFGDISLGDPVKKEEIKIVYYKKDKKKDSATGLF